MDVLRVLKTDRSNGLRADKTHLCAASRSPYGSLMLASEQQATVMQQIMMSPCFQFYIFDM